MLQGSKGGKRLEPSFKDFKQTVLKLAGKNHFSPRSRGQEGATKTNEETREVALRSWSHHHRMLLPAPLLGGERHTLQCSLLNRCAAARPTCAAAIPSDSAAC